MLCVSKLSVVACKILWLGGWELVTHAKRSLQNEKCRWRSIVMGDSDRSLDAELVDIDGGRTSMT